MKEEKNETKGDSDMRLTVETRYGKVRGVNCGSTRVFRGIPYAAAPVGNRRWKAPIEPAPFAGVFEADTFAPMSIQAAQNPDGSQIGFNYGKEFYSDSKFLPPMSEDCLYLNIWTPADAKPGDGLPVGFYIHGGAFIGGFGSEKEFDGEGFAQRGIILVTINYRLGALGFLAHPWLSAEEGSGGVSGNYGILDQIAALRWVYDNISAFGGEPSNITVFGQSAGCMSTQVLVSSDLTDHMIAKAILQSGVSCEANILLTPSLSEESDFGEKFVNMALRESGYREEDLSPEEGLKSLRSISPEKMLEIQGHFLEECFRDGSGLCLVPCVDGMVLKKSVREVYREGTMKKIPYMTGFVKNDIGQTPEDAAGGRAGVIEDECRRWSEKAAASAGCPTYMYAFLHDLPGDGSGAFHSSELWYMFETLGRCWRPMTDEDMKLADEMSDCWASFMKTGVPDPEKKSWEPYSEGAFVKEFL